jgi:acyl carrier protein
VTTSVDIITAVRQCVAELLGIEVSDVSPEATLLDLGTDSLQFVELVLYLETVFNITLPRRYAIPDEHTCQSYAHAISAALAERQNEGLTYGGSIPD